jgi:hypothetical protein
MEIKTLPTISVPLVALQYQAEYWRDQQKKYAVAKLDSMESWADGKASVYEAIIEAWGHTAV